MSDDWCRMFRERWYSQLSHILRPPINSERPDFRSGGVLTGQAYSPFCLSKMRLLPCYTSVTRCGPLRCYYCRMRACGPCLDGWHLTRRAAHQIRSAYRIGPESRRQRGVLVPPEEHERCILLAIVVRKSRPTHSTPIQAGHMSWKLLCTLEECYGVAEVVAILVYWCSRPDRSDGNFGPHGSAQSDC